MTTVNVRMTREVLEEMWTRDHLGRRVRIEWGEPDAEGYLTPTFTVDLDDPLAQDARDGEALRLLYAACPEGWFVTLGSGTNGFTGQWSASAIEMRTRTSGDRHVINAYHPTIEDACDITREELEELLLRVQ